MRTPPGLHFDKSKKNSWTCIPDVYHELSDPDTTLDDCDCNCGDLDPDCQLLYNNIYCAEYLDVAGIPIPRSWEHGVTCEVDASSGFSGAHCVAQDTVDFACAQLPPVMPNQLVKVGAAKGRPPPEWTCAPESWNPRYSTFKCNGAVLNKEMMYCRLDSARCTALPPGIHDNLWTCIPDVYHELSDNGTKLDDCDCNCGSLDPDCLLDYNDLYCEVNGRVEKAEDATCVYKSRQTGAECLWKPLEVKLNQRVAEAVWALAIFSVIACLALTTSLVRHRESKLIKASSFAFSVALILACVISKTRGEGSETFAVPHHIRFQDIKVAALVGAFVLGTFFLLGLYFLIDPPLYELNQFQVKGGPVYFFHACHVSPVFVPLIFALYTVFIGLVGLVVDFVLPKKEITGKMLVRAVALLIGALTPVAVLYIPKEVKKAVDARYQPDIELQYISNPHPLNNSNRSATDNRSQISAMSGLSDDGEEDFEIELAVAMLRGDADATIKEFLEVFPNGKQQQQRKQPMLEKAATILQIQRDSLVDEVSEGLHESSNGATRFHGSRSNSNSNTPVLATRSLNQNKKAASNRNSPTGSKPGSNRDSPTMTRRSSVQHNRTRSVGRSPKILPEPAEARNLKTINVVFPLSCLFQHSEMPFAPPPPYFCLFQPAPMPFSSLLLPFLSAIVPFPSVAALSPLYRPFPLGCCLFIPQLNETNTAALIATRRRSVEPSIGGKYV
eukprot:g49804.t1